MLGGLGGSADDDDDDELDDDMDDLDDMDDPDGLDDDDESFAALAETLLARALLGRDKYAPKALMRAASMAAEVLAARGMPLPPLPLLAGYAARLASVAVWNLTTDQTSELLFSVKSKFGRFLDESKALVEYRPKSETFVYIDVGLEI